MQCGAFGKGKLYRASWYIAGTSPCCAAFWYLKAHYFTAKAELTE
jgi:hypothetical protein